MMFMADSGRSAELALEYDLDAGLHLNFTLEFSGSFKPNKLREYQQTIAAFLLRNKYCSLLYNPLLRKHFDYVYKAQYEEYTRLYKRIPTHIDGHDHMHLCMNLIIDKIIPEGSKVRRNFSFPPGEKGFLNRSYRRIVDLFLKRRYTCTDFFFSVSPIHSGRLQRIVKHAQTSYVELMVHPEKPNEYGYLMSEEFQQVISHIETGTYVTL